MVAPLGAVRAHRRAGGRGSSRVIPWRSRTVPPDPRAPQQPIPPFSYTSRDDTVASDLQYLQPCKYPSAAASIPCQQEGRDTSRVHHPDLRQGPCAADPRPGRRTGHGLLRLPTRRRRVSPRIDHHAVGDSRSERHHVDRLQRGERTGRRAPTGRPAGTHPDPPQCQRNRRRGVAGHRVAATLGRPATRPTGTIYGSSDGGRRP